LSKAIVITGRIKPSKFKAFRTNKKTMPRARGATSQAQAGAVPRQVEEQLITWIKQEGVIKSKKALFAGMRKAGVPSGQLEPTLVRLKGQKVVKYRNRRPRGYLHPSTDITPYLEPPPEPRGKQVTSRMVNNPTAARKRKHKELIGADRPLAEIQKTIDATVTKFMQSCPRCGGQMFVRPIRCGPEKVLAVNLCSICHFHLPVV
jgi:predicted RNA-binding Zn-ribbon protein involved in translation (DUF1610 family)